MLVMNVELRQRTKKLGFYEYHFNDPKFLEKIKRNIFSILVEFGKVSTMGRYSVSNMNNIGIDIERSNNDIKVIVQWGKSEEMRAKIEKTLNSMLFLNEGASVNDLEKWVKGKRAFFKNYPAVMSKRAGIFYDRRLARTDKDYAEMMRGKFNDSSPSLNSGPFVFRGLRKNPGRTHGNPYMPIYTQKTETFYEKIERTVYSLVKQRMRTITKATIDRYIREHKGSSKYTIVVDDALIIYKRAEYEALYGHLAKAGIADINPESLSAKITNRAKSMGKYIYKPSVANAPVKVRLQKVENYLDVSGQIENNKDKIYNRLINKISKGK